MQSRRGVKNLILGGVGLVASLVAFGQDEGERGKRQLTELERTRLLGAEERAALRRRAAEDAERSADELEAAAMELERLARSAEAAATAARKRADEARVRARAARAGLADQVVATAAQPEIRDVPPPAPPAPPETLLTIFDRQAAAEQAARVMTAASRTASQNKAAFLPDIRARRGWDTEVRTEIGSLTHKAGEAPDIGDVDFTCHWQWALNVTRGGVPDRGESMDGAFKTGHIDLARLTFEPEPEGFGAAGMKWGMRRYNLGDVTVTDCDFTGIPKEHGIYDSVSGHALYRGNTFLRLGGQAIQYAHRAGGNGQYGADNLPYSAPPLTIVEDCHAVDVGLDASRSAFAWTFFDPGSYEHPGTIVLRGSTLVCAWPFTRTSGGQTVGPEHPRALRSSGGLVVTHYADAPEGGGHPTRDLVIDACLFDLTMSEHPVAAVRGVESIHVEDSVFIARQHRRPYFDVDDADGGTSGRVVIQNCISPPGHEVWLRIRGKKVMSLHSPGKRFEIDVATGRIEETEPRDTPLTRVVSPLANRTVRPGIHPQRMGHIDDLGVLDFSEIR